MDIIGKSDMLITSGSQRVNEQPVKLSLTVELKGTFSPTVLKDCCL